MENTEIMATMKEVSAPDMEMDLAKALSQAKIKAGAGGCLIGAGAVGLGILTYHVVCKIIGAKNEKDVSTEDTDNEK